MRTLKALLPLLLIGAAPPTSIREHADLMNEIEHSIVLPKGARPLSAYGRNYAFSAHDKVMAIYLVPPPPLGASAGCEVMLKDFKSRPCTKREIQEMAKSDARHVAAQTPAGKRRWYKDAQSLPSISDGGCMQVNVEYDISAHHLLVVACNGFG